jgi:hypothetical protein
MNAKAVIWLPDVKHTWCQGLGGSLLLMTSQIHHQNLQHYPQTMQELPENQNEGSDTVLKLLHF